MTVKHEFASVEWFEAARSLLQSKIDANPEAMGTVDFSMCEVYTGVPDHIGDGLDSVGWHARIQHGKLTMLREESDDVHLKVVADYETILPFARAPMAEMTSPELQEHMAKATAEGKVSFNLNGAPVTPPGFESIHDEFAAFTK